MAAINVRGTGGSGKSTLIRRIMERYSVKGVVHREGRKQPISYLLSNGNSTPLEVIGHYETACGGCDTISSPDEVYRLVHEALDAGHHVLFEGIIIGDDVTRAVGLKKRLGADFHVIALNTPIEVCLAGIQARRDARGETKPLSETNTRSRAERLKRIMARLKDSSVNARWMSRDDALAEVAGILGVGQLADVEEQLREEGA